MRDLASLVMSFRSILQRGWKRWSLLFCGSLIGYLLVVLMHPVQAVTSHIAEPLDTVSTSNPQFPIALATPTVAQSSSPFIVSLSQGKTFFDAGQFTDAIAQWTVAVRSAQNADERLGEALGLSYLSLAYQSLGQWSEAEDAILQSLSILEVNSPTQPPISSEQQSIYAQALNTRAALSFAQGQTETALNLWQQAETVYAQREDDVGRLGSQINQAQALQAMGLYHQASRQLDQVATGLQSQPDSRLKAIGLRSLGNLLHQGGKFDQSQVLLEESLTTARMLGLPIEINASSLSLGNHYKSVGDIDTALDLYSQAAENAVSDLEKVQAQLNQLKLLAETGRLSESQPLVDSLQAEIIQLPPSRPAIYARINFVDSLLGLPGMPLASSPSAKPNKAENETPDVTALASILSAGIQQARTIQDVRAEAYALGELARLYEVNQQWESAKVLTEKALVLSQSIQASDIAYRWDWQLGRILRQQNKASEAINAYADAINLLQSLRRDLIASDPDLQFSFRQQIEPIYREFVSLLVEPQEPSQANLKKAREVIESLQLAELENFFRAACLDVQPKQIDQVDQSAAVIYPIILPDRLAVILSLPGQSFELYQVNTTAEDVQQKIDGMLTALNPLISEQRRLQVSQEMYQWLIEPAEEILAEQNIQTLVFVLDGGLRNIPMAALYDGEQYLIEKYQIAITPGLQLLASQQLTPNNIEVLIGGLTEARQGFDALPGVAVEADQIASSTDSRIYLDQNFTEPNLQDQIGQTSFPVIHLATHGQFSSNPEDTFVLTWDDQITIEGLRQLLKSRTEAGRNPIELLVLSACQTAEGDERAALGLAGLSVRSGARSTLATLWAVNDQSTAEFMSVFYKELTGSGKGKAESLRATQIELLKHSEYSHPYYWAPFILVGNWL
ncbi:MAG: CHAT domain-containing protein [Cyanobacteria bacterium P01_F01_bin.150]